MLKRRNLWGLFAVAGIGLLLYANWRRQPAPTNLQTQQSLSELDWAGVEWEDLQSLWQSEGEVHEQLKTLLANLPKEVSPPARYFAGLLHLAHNEPLPALECFALVAPTEIPAHYLYAPYRLHATQRPGGPNPYRGHLRKAVEAKQVTPLIRARFMNAEGQLADSLAMYLATDPAQWTSFDLQCINAFLQHAGLAAEAKSMLVAAVSSGRVPSRLQRDISRSLSNRSPMETAFRQRFTSQTLNDGELTAAAESLNEISRIRTLFVQRKYDELLEEVEQRPALQATHEAVLMCFLSALRLEDRSRAQLWGAELRRRHPEPEAVKWVETLTRDTFGQS